MHVRDFAPTITDVGRNTVATSMTPDDIGDRKNYVTNVAGARVGDLEVALSLSGKCSIGDAEKL